MPTPLFLTGFEYQVLSTSGSGTNVGLFNTIAGGATIDTTTFRNGAAALKTTSTTASAQHRVIRTLASHMNQIGRIAIRISAAPATTATIMEIGDGAATITYHQFVIKPDRTIRAQWFNGTSTLSVDGPVLSVDTWYVLDWHFDGNSAAERRTEWRVNGAAQTAATAVPSTSATAAYNNTRIGAAGGNAEASNYTLWADDWIVSSTTADYPIGDGKVIALRPASDGTHSFTANDFSTGDAGTQRAPSYTDFYLMVDETAATTARSTTDNITQRVLRANGYVEINPGDTPESGTANGVRALLAYSSPTTTANRMACIARTSAGFAGVLWGDLPVAQGGNGGATNDYSESSNFFKDVIVTKPAGGWTASEVNQIHWRLGGSGDVSPVPTVQFLMLELDYPVAGSVSFDAQPGSFTVAGVAASALAARSINGVPGAYSLTGFAATLARGFMLSADPGGYSFTGLAAALQAARTLPSDPGSFVLTGLAAPVVAGRVVSADPGTYVLTGNAATLLAARMLSGDPGSYAVAGAVAGVVVGRVLSSDPGVYVLTGVDATLLKAAAGAYALTADPGSFSLSGAAAGVVAGRVLDATPGSYSLIGAAATLLADRVVQASPGAFVVTGVAAAAVADRLIAALPASYALSGLASGLVVDRVIQTSPGVYTVVGHDAGLFYSGGAVVVLKNLNLLRVGE